MLLFFGDLFFFFNYFYFSLFLDFSLGLCSDYFIFRLILRIRLFFFGFLCFWFVLGFLRFALTLRRLICVLLLGFLCFWFVLGFIRFALTLRRLICVLLLGFFLFLDLRFFWIVPGHRRLFCCIFLRSFLFRPNKWLFRFYFRLLSNNFCFNHRGRRLVLLLSCKVRILHYSLFRIYFLYYFQFLNLRLRRQRLIRLFWLRRQKLRRLLRGHWWSFFFMFQNSFR